MTQTEMGKAREFLVRYTSALCGPPRLVVLPNDAGQIRLSMERSNDGPITFFLTRVSTAPADVGVQMFSRLLRLTQGVKATRDFSKTEPLPDFLQPLLMEEVAQKALAANLQGEENLQVFCFKPRESDWRRSSGAAHDPPTLFICRTASEAFVARGINGTFEGRVRFLDLFSAEAGWKAQDFPNPDGEFVIFRDREPVDEDGNLIEPSLEQIEAGLAANSRFKWRDLRIGLWLLARLPQCLLFTIKHKFERWLERRENRGSKSGGS